LIGGVGRWLRGGMVGLSATALATSGHALEGGPAPAVAVIATLAVLAVLVSVGLSRARWKLPSLLVMLTAAQVIFHVALAGHVTAAEGVSWSMLAAHSTAAVLTACLLRRGEDACWWLADCLARPVRAVRAASVVAPVALSAPWALHSSNRRSGRYLVHVAPRRGPPHFLDSLTTR
jgi:heme/copper-type cytochrome/quinol oxidase subunit 4